MRKAEIKYQDLIAGYLTEDENGYHFVYDADYLEIPKAKPLSKTLPLQSEVFHSAVLFPFFDGLIPEGWLLHLAEKNWKIAPRDRMGLLCACCKDCIGAVSVHPIIDQDDV